MSSMSIFPDDHRNQPTNNINNRRYNPLLLNHLETLVVVAYTNLVFLLTIFVPYLPVVMINGICFPTFFYCFNAKLRQFYLRQFWENAPSFLQPFNPNCIIEINIPDNNIELGPLPRNRYSKKGHIRTHTHKKRAKARF